MSDITRTTIKPLAIPGPDEWNALEQRIEQLEKNYRTPHITDGYLQVANQELKSALSISVAKNYAYISNRNDFKNNNSTQNKPLIISSDQPIFLQTKKNGLVVHEEGNVSIPNGSLTVNGSIAANNSELIFTNIEHDHAGAGQVSGHAAIDNAKDYNALMILGRHTPQGRRVRLWDYLEVNGQLDVVNGGLKVEGTLHAQSALQLEHGTHVNVISDDATLQNKGTHTLCTEQAIRNYIDQAITGVSSFLQVGTVDMQDAKFSDEDGERYSAKVVKFPRSFSHPPTIIAGIKHLDAHTHKGRNLRFDIGAESVSHSECTLRFNTWADTRIYGVTAFWIAFGQ